MGKKKNEEEEAGAEVETSEDPKVKAGTGKEAGVVCYTANFIVNFDIFISTLEAVSVEEAAIRRGIRGTKTMGKSPDVGSHHYIGTCRLQDLNT